MNTTEEYWDVDGSSLNTMAKNIETLGGRSGLPALAGENFKVAYRAGRVWRRKSPDERVVSLAMWVIGATDDGVVSAVEQTKRIKYNENWRALKKLFYNSNRQVSLTKRWRETSGLLSATAQAEIRGTMEPSMIGRYGSRFVVDFLLSDPFFYGPAIASSPLAVGVPLVINNTGDDVIAKGTIRLNGPLTNPRITNATPSPDVWFQYNGVIGGGAYVDLDLDLFTATTNLGVNVIGSITHDGAHRWMEMLVGNNSLTLTADAGAGTAVFTYQIPYT